MINIQFEIDPNVDKPNTEISSELISRVISTEADSNTHLRANETPEHLVCRVVL